MKMRGQVSYPVDSDGYLVNRSSRELIAGNHLELIESDVSAIASILSSVSSLYVRGSVSSGTSHPYSSDLDLVVIVESDPKPAQMVAIADAVECARLAHSCILASTDVSVVTMSDFHGSKWCAGLRVNLAVESVLLSGNDVRTGLPRLRPGRELAYYNYPCLAESFDLLRTRLLEDSAAVSYNGIVRERSFWCVWTMRELLRSAHSLAMPLLGIFERDLEKCRLNASSVYPVFADDLKLAYEWAMNPTVKSRELTSFLDAYLAKFLPIWRNEIIRGRKS